MSRSSGVDLAIADRLAITDVVNRYVDLLDGKHWEHFDEALSEDAVARFSPGDALEGRSAILAAVQGMLGTDEVLTLHHVASFTPVVDGDTAEANVRVHAMHWGAGRREGRFYESQGIQVTRFARTADGWRISDFEWRVVARFGGMDVFTEPA